MVGSRSDDHTGHILGDRNLEVLRLPGRVVIGVAEHDGVTGGAQGVLNPPRKGGKEWVLNVSGITSAITSELWVRNDRAVRLGVKASSSAAARTASDLPDETGMPLNTRETVAGETPAFAATS